MTTPDRTIEEIAERLVAGNLTRDEAQRLARGIPVGEISRDDLAESLLVHGLLVGRGVDVEGGLAAMRVRLRRAGRSPVRGRLLWAAAVAAAVLVVVALTLVLRRPVEPTGVRLVDGALTGSLAEGKTVPLGRTIGTGGTAASLVCDDGCRIELAARSRVSLHRDDGDDRWRVDLVEGGVTCDVATGGKPFRVHTPLIDVVTEGTRFDVRLGTTDDGTPGVLVRVTDGRVRVEQSGRPSVPVRTGEMRLFPVPDTADARILTLRMLFPDEEIWNVAWKREDGLLEIEGRTGTGGIEVKVAPDGTVESYAREYRGDKVPAVLPAVVREAIETKYGSHIRWIEAEVGFRGNVPFYEAELRVGGREIEVRIDAQGNITEHSGEED